MSLETKLKAVRITITTVGVGCILAVVGIALYSFNKGLLEVQQALRWMLALMGLCFVSGAGGLWATHLLLKAARDEEVLDAFSRN